MDRANLSLARSLYINMSTYIWPITTTIVSHSDH
jgi:hypothetical protein